MSESPALLVSLGPGQGFRHHLMAEGTYVTQPPSIEATIDALAVSIGMNPYVALDHELLIAKFRLKLKKVEMTTRPFRYDLNQIPYDYTVEVRNRFKGIDLIDRVSDQLWMEVHGIVQETGIKTILKKKKCKKAKWLSEEALQIAVKRREVKSKAEKERYSYLNAEFQRIARRDKKAFLSNQCQERGKQQNGKD